MRQYRCYRLDGAGRFVGVEAFAAAAEQEACARAAALARDLSWEDFELWEQHEGGARQVTCHAPEKARACTAGIDAPDALQWRLIDHLAVLNRPATPERPVAA